jgi:hypothetical protein
MHTLIISKRIKQAISHLNDQREAIFDKSKGGINNVRKSKRN